MEFSGESCVTEKPKLTAAEEKAAKAARHAAKANGTTITGEEKVRQALARKAAEKKAAAVKPTRKEKEEAEAAKRRMEQPKICYSCLV